MISLKLHLDANRELHTLHTHYSPLSPAAFKNPSPKATEVFWSSEHEPGNCNKFYTSLHPGLVSVGERVEPSPDSVT